MAHRLLLKDASVLYGSDLAYLPCADIVIEGDRFVSVVTDDLVHGDDMKYSSHNDDHTTSHTTSHITDTDTTFDTSFDTAFDTTHTNHTVIDCKGLLVMPGLINCHTHIGDSIGKDARLKGTVDQKIHPVFGLKSRILSQTPPDTLVEFMKYSCMLMLKGGTTTFVDFREGGLLGTRMLRRALDQIPIRGIIMGRIDNYHNSDDIHNDTPLSQEKISELQNLILECNGLGISGANENSDAVLETYSKCDTLRAIHAAETQESTSHSEILTGTSETIRALKFMPNFLVHMTYATVHDLEAVAESSSVRGIVVCPRANSALAEGLPDIITMQRHSHCKLALGTDNVMVNTPDMFREMDYIWKLTMGMHKETVEPVEILKMATVNAGAILDLDIGQIASGMIADCVFIDKHSIEVEPMHNPHAAIVHRVDISSIKAVMIRGKIVHGQI